ncbi:N-6 DNA methylase [Kitasatospora brasiliensis]|uniref:N-6 DNA methylase n=1 Tax=Kitasatospora brasiliensis TaxID=3058040 RepID=UPI002931160F|nr:N-6 DNA methylase [Kitasatospora sp. K002]
MTERDEPVTITLAGIARLAGVGRAAVSNWRRRNADFPVPVGGTDASPQFSLDDIESWLRLHGKVDESAGGWGRLWPRIEDLGDRDRMGRVVAETGLLLAEAAQGSGQLAAELTDAERDLVDEALRLSHRDGSRTGFRVLLERWLSAHVRQVTTTPPSLADTMAEIAAELRGTAEVRHVVDPACGVGNLLESAARRWGGEEGLRLTAVDSDPVSARLTMARLALERPEARSTVLTADTLREDPVLNGPADVVLCNPPANERDWGHAELATDRRWQHGQPPRTESELAWIQHILSVLGEDGVAVVLLPPAVASRRAGRRIRAALLRSGVVRGVVALPTGAAPPYGVGLHLWLLSAPGRRPAAASVLFVDAADCRTTSSGGKGTVIDWDSVRDRTVSALRGAAAERTAAVPVVDLIGDETDLAPARHVPAEAAATAVDLGRGWAGLDSALLTLRDSSAVLRPLGVVAGATEPLDVSIAELEQSGAVALSTGAAVASEHLRRGMRPEGAVEVVVAVTSAELPGETQWVDAESAQLWEAAGEAVLTAFGDVVVVGTAFGFDAWVETEAPRVLGQHLYRVRVDQDVLDPFFLAACLRVRANARRAGTHASSSSRVDVRRLRVLRLPVEEQRQMGELHRQLVKFEQAVEVAGLVGRQLGSTLAALLAGGRLRRM